MSNSIVEAFVIRAHNATFVLRFAVDGQPREAGYMPVAGEVTALEDAMTNLRTVRVRLDGGRVIGLVGSEE